MKLMPSFKKGLQGIYQKKYLAIYIATVCNFALLFLWMFLSQEHSSLQTFMSGVFFVLVFGWMFFVLPSSLIAYGIISYKTTKKIILPHFLLFIAFALITFVCLWFKGVYSLEDCVMSLGFPIAMTILSLIVSIITAIVQKVRKKQID